MADEKTTLTDGEMRILRAIFAHMNGKPDVDWDAAATTASLGNAKSLKERYRQMCVRLGWNNKNGGTATSAPPSTPKKKNANPSNVVKRSGGGQRGRKKKEVTEDEEDEDVVVKAEDETAPALENGEV